MHTLPCVANGFAVSRGFGPAWRWENANDVFGVIVQIVVVCFLRILWGNRIEAPIMVVSLLVQCFDGCPFLRGQELKDFILKPATWYTSDDVLVGFGLCGFFLAGWEPNVVLSARFSVVEALLPFFALLGASLEVFVRLFVFFSLDPGNGLPR